MGFFLKKVICQMSEGGGLKNNILSEYSLLSYFVHIDDLSTQPLDFKGFEAYLRLCQICHKCQTFFRENKKLSEIGLTNVFNIVRCKYRNILYITINN
jgi:hypothetical protein